MANYWLCTKFMSMIIINNYYDNNKPTKPVVKGMYSWLADFEY